MYCYEMRVLIKAEAKAETLRIRNQTFHDRGNSIILHSLIDIKFYQKLFVLLIACSTFLIFPESPRELETVCNSYYSKTICNVY